MLDPRIYRAALIPVLFALIVGAFSLQRPSAAHRDHAGARRLLGVARAGRPRRVGARLSRRAARATAATRRSAAQAGRRLPRDGLLPGQHAVLRGRDRRRQAPPDHGHRAPGRPARARARRGRPPRRARPRGARRAVGHRGDARARARGARRAPEAHGDLRLDQRRQRRRWAARATSPSACTGRRRRGARARRPRRHDRAPAVRGRLVDGRRRRRRCSCAAPSRPPCARRRAPTRAARARRRSGRASPSRSRSASRGRSWPATCRRRCMSVGGERPPRGRRPDRARAALQAFGRAALRTLTALDNTPDARARRLDPRARHDAQGAARCGPCACSSAALLLAPMLVAVDGFARVRRRHEPVGPWLWWIVAAAAPIARRARLRLGAGRHRAAAGHAARARARPARSRCGTAGDGGAGGDRARRAAGLDRAAARAAAQGRRRPGAASAARARAPRCSSPGARWPACCGCATRTRRPCSSRRARAARRRRPRACACGAASPSASWPSPPRRSCSSTCRSPASSASRRPHFGWFCVLLVAGGVVGPLGWVIWSLVLACLVAALLMALRSRSSVTPPETPADHRARPGQLRGAGLARRHRVRAAAMRRALGHRARRGGPAGAGRRGG